MNDGRGLEVLVVSADGGIRETACAELEDAGFRAATCADSGAMLTAIYASPPQCLVLDASRDGAALEESVRRLKADNVYGHLPVLLILAREETATESDWEALPADDYLMESWTPGEVVSRVRLALARARRDIDANPLTGLPGNQAIMREAGYRLGSGRSFALAYLDLDNFKPYNDKYGFSRGDEVLRMTARVLVNAVTALDSSDTHVGHVGGDDFIFLTPPECLVEVCDEVTRNFDSIVPSFYDEEDRQAGVIRSTDRRGGAKTFPLMTVTIVALDTGTARIKHLAAASTRLAELKRYAKRSQKSNYVLDRRK
ncbi:MAG: diguanylate cyclase [Nitrospiraceae bacterium]|nr:diguanylate cyclase [Nitrospiraceae bacterium]